MLGTLSQIKIEKIHAINFRLKIIQLFLFDKNKIEVKTNMRTEPNPTIKIKVKSDQLARIDLTVKINMGIIKINENS